MYLVLAVALWWHAWQGGAASTLAAGSVDPAQQVWFLAWVPHVLGHGGNPLFARDMFFPSGLNLLANTSFLLLGLLLAPVTVLFGPVAAFTVAVTLAPAADALAAFVAVRRFVSWAPAAFVAGLLYGFGPFVATDLRYGHLNLTMLVFPPLLLVLLDRMVRRGQGRRVPWGVAAGVTVAVVAEFFVSTEMLALTVLVGAVALLVLAVADRRRLAERGVAVSAAMAAAVVAAGAALAYPLWWYLRGPQHFTGAVWSDMRRFSASLASFVVPHGELPGVGYLSGGNGDYLGVGLLLVLAAGVLVWRRAGILLLAVGMALVSMVLSLGPSLHAGRPDTGIPLPAWPVLHLPLLDSVAPSRFAAFTDLWCALALAVVLDRLHAAVAAHVGGARRPGPGRVLPVALPVVVAAAALVPPALVQPWPYAVHHLEEPSVLRALDHLAPGTVVREYPLVTSTAADALVWQARGGIRYTMVDGYAIVPGTHGRAGVRPPADTLGLVFAGIALGRLVPPFASTTVAAVRAHAWDHDVSVVAVVARAPGARTAAAFLGAALGPPSRSDPSGWLWRR